MLILGFLMIYQLTTLYSPNKPLRRGEILSVGNGRSKDLRDYGGCCAQLWPDPQRRLPSADHGRQGCATMGFLRNYGGMHGFSTFQWSESMRNYGARLWRDRSGGF